MKYSHLLLTVFVSALALGCGKDKITIASPESAAEAVDYVPFTLTATQGDPDTRLTIDSDGLNTTWQPGDKLYLVDLAGKNNTVTLETSITEPSKSASFVSKTSVLSGEYVVLYGTSVREIGHPSHKMTDLSTLSSRMTLYGSLSVADGQTSAALRLYPVFAKLSFKFKNFPTGLKNVTCGMMELNGDIPTQLRGTIGTSGWVKTTETSISRWTFSWNNGSDAALLIAPVDLTGKKLYFYVYGDDASGNHVTYEYIKDGINLKAGTNYNLTFDFSNPSNKSTMTYSSSMYSLGSPADFRAAAYWKSYNTYTLTADVDFTGEAVFPIYLYKLKGNSRTLSNVNIDWAKRDSVGILCSGGAEYLTVKNVTVKGKQYVGGIASRNTYSITSCNLDGTVEITGTSRYVGGIVGYAYSPVLNCKAFGSISGGDYTGGVTGSGSVTGSTLKEGSSVSGGNYTGGLCGSGTVTDCAVEDNCTITGAERTGGLTGNAGATLSGCKIGKNLKVAGTNYVGGLCGYFNNSSANAATGFILKEGATISGTSQVGGLLGYSYGSYTSASNSTQAVLLKCGFEGTVTASSDKAGGLIGNNGSGTIEKCYAVAKVTASNYAGGIIGQGGTSYCFNSYSLGDVTATNGTYSGGISGYNSAIKNCYSYGTISSGNGICPNLNSNYTSYNLTSSSVMGSSTNAAYCSCSAEKTFLSLLNVINGDEAYSTQVWANIDAKCPLLQWQSDLFGGEIVAPGFGDENW